MQDKPLYPMRINKYLALKQYSTRRGADELISTKKVFINGKLAVLGDKVQEKDKVEVKGHSAIKNYVYYAYNKPVGVITHSPQEGEDEIKDIFPIPGVFPIGRLDKNSSGLIILTNDGRITDKLLNPEYSHEKEYLVKTRDKIRSNFKEKMEAGVDIDGYITKNCKVDVLNENTFRITLTEGKKHQIRRMCVALFNEVYDLRRTRIMNIPLGRLYAGEYRPIEGKELSIFLKSLGF
ncbi:MAG: rRNA pseudouridine synthase [Candidatus Pacebacteria bacterium]|nr:rRNA pseudouridine synthase [Candidatus Paceibacterota bacterium]